MSDERPLEQPTAPADTPVQLSAETLARLSVVSRPVHTNRHFLAVAACVALSPGDMVRTPEIARMMGGTAPSHKILEVLSRLVGAGLMVEIPGYGPPHPRLFERCHGTVPDAFWDFARAVAGE